MEQSAYGSKTGLYFFHSNFLEAILIKIFKINIFEYFIKLLQQYLDAAEQDKERYNREIIDYKQTEAYRIFNEKQSEKQNESKKERNGSEVSLEQNVTFLGVTFCPKIYF